MTSSTSSSSSPSKPKRERRKEARPAELLAAALDLFVEKGYAATKVEEVAKMAGVSKGTLFLYYASKEELFKAVVRENISQRFDALAQLWDNFKGSSTDMLRIGLRAWWERIGSTKASGIPKLMISEESNFPELAAFYSNEVVQPIHVLLEKVLQKGVDQGEFRPIDIQQATFTILAPMLYLVIRKHSPITYALNNKSIDPDAFIEAQIDNILHGLCKHSPIPASISSL
jgi:TetR/AcrR family transcriptional regulator